MVQFHSKEVFFESHALDEFKTPIKYIKSALNRLKNYE